MIKVFSSFFLTMTVTSSLFAATLTSSQRISQAVDAISPLALTGVAVYKIPVAKARNVKMALRQLAIQTEIYETEEDWNWLGTDSNAWNVDETAFGETTMKDAYGYIMSRPDESATEEELADFRKNLPTAKEGFKLFLGTGVMFGVVPLGATQCGVQFPGLAIIDPHTGTIYVFSKEGSGC